MCWRCLLAGSMSATDSIYIIEEAKLVTEESNEFSECLVRTLLKWTHLSLVCLYSQTQCLNCHLQFNRGTLGAQIYILEVQLSTMS